MENKKLITKPFRNMQDVKGPDDTVMVPKNDAIKYAEEILKCKNDPIYFAEKYFYINGARGEQVITLYDKQKEMIRNFMKHKFAIVLSSRQNGKCVVGDTLVKLKNKKTGKEETVSLKELFEKTKNI